MPCIAVGAVADDDKLSVLPLKVITDPVVVIPVTVVAAEETVTELS